MSATIESNISEVLATCLQEIEAKRATVQDCVERFPQHPELGTLLRLRVRLQDLEQPSMNPMRVHLLEQRLMNNFSSIMVPEKPKPAVVRRNFKPLLRLAVAFCFVIIFGIFVSIGTISAAANAIPGDSLYGVKRTVENFELQLASGDWRESLRCSLASRRVDEATQLILRGKTIDDAFIEEVHGALSMVPIDTISLTPAEERLAKQASYLSDLLKSQPSPTLAMSRLSSELDTFAAAAPTAVGYPTAVTDATKPPTVVFTETVIPTVTIVPTEESTEIPTRTHIPPTIKPTQIKPTKVPTQIRPQPTQKPPSNPGGNGNGNGGNGNGGNNNSPGK